MFLALSPRLWLVARREGTEARMVSEATANIAGVCFYAGEQSSKQFGVPLRPINTDTFEMPRRRLGTELSMIFPANLCEFRNI